MEVRLCSIIDLFSKRQPRTTPFHFIIVFFFGCFSAIQSDARAPHLMKLLFSLSSWILVKKCNDCTKSNWIIYIEYTESIMTSFKRKHTVITHTDGCKLKWKGKTKVNRMKFYELKTIIFRFMCLVVVNWCTSAVCQYRICPFSRTLPVYWYNFKQIRLACNK